jgi:steroid delta-isomerase
MPSPEQIHDVIGRYAASVSSADKEAILACFSDDATVIDPYPSPPCVGKEAIGAFWDGVMALGTPAAFLPEKTVVCADRAVFLFAIITVNDAGLITELVAYWDLSQIAPRPPA